VAAAAAAGATVIAAFVIEQWRSDVVHLDFLAGFERKQPGEVADYCDIHYAVHVMLFARRGVRAVCVFVRGVAK
jgi:hypothetical protein